MAVKDWHFGKIVLLWVCGMLPIAALLVGLTVVRTSSEEEALVIISVAVLVALVFLVPITWKWLSGKEKRD